MASTLLLHATQQGDAQLVSTLLAETRVSSNCANSSGSSPLHYAAQGGYISILEILLRSGANPDVKTQNIIGGNTPLHIAVDMNFLKVVEILLNFYANPNLLNAVGFTPLHIAARKGYLDCVKLLLSRGAEPEVLDQQGKTPYYWAKEYNHPDITALLPEFKYDWLKPQKVRMGELVRVTIVPEAESKDKKKKKKVTKKKGGKKKKKK